MQYIYVCVCVYIYIYIYIYVTMHGNFSKLSDNLKPVGFPYQAKF